MPTLQTLYTICDRTIAAKKDEDETKNIIGNDDEVHKGSQLPVSFNISIWQYYTFIKFLITEAV